MELRNIMGIREKIDQSHKVIRIAASAVILLSVVMIARQLFKSRFSAAAPIIKAFYSDDDGKSWFVEETTELPPIDHGGKVAVRVEVFRCNGGEPFVGYLERYSDAAKARITAGAAKNGNPAAPAIIDEPMEVKRPGEVKWVEANVSKPSYGEYLRIITPTGPDGQTGSVVPVTPH
jgi:hypothetical protein